MKLAIQLSEGQGRRLAEIAALLDISAESCTSGFNDPLFRPTGAGRSRHGPHRTTR